MKASVRNCWSQQGPRAVARGCTDLGICSARLVVASYIVGFDAGREEMVEVLLQ